ncbi:MAG: hypothetical protein MSB11_00565 [Prevotella sp.]|nr:hypothetical protein [Prevotella sp.]
MISVLTAIATTLGISTF